ncbi:MAG TPA: GNAT family N-acetyltransferase [Myxococcales bacterium]|jgi:FemAB-related protein (PEP-CTERM system-associated)|nr:GNAT family N-acetyltransferase [Myxococcales bacterium]
MVIEELDPAAAAEWDAYVSGKEAANCYHLHGWRIAGERGYGLRAPYLVARSRPRGELLGALPLFFVRSPPLRGYATTGLFGSYGPLLAEDARIAASLLREACRRARDAGLASFRFKGLGEEPAAAGFIPLDHWVVATLPLWASPEQAWAAIRGKERNLVRKARGYGLEVQRGPEGLAAFYDVLADNMHHKGAPIYGRGFIEELLRAFPGAAEVVTVNRESRCVAGAVTITFKGVMAIPFLSSRPDSLWLRPNVLLVWDIISRACRAGVRTLDFGTSLRGSSALEFKLHWGARTTPRSILVRALRGRPPAMNVESPLVRAGIGLWQRLPRAWADALGPRVCARFLA